MTLKEFVTIASARFFVQEIREWRDGNQYHYLKRLIPPGAWFSVSVAHLDPDETLDLFELQSMCSQLRLPLSAFGVTTS